jgi:hypothetical protein
MHILTPPISPTSILAGPSAALQALSDCCPGCFSPHPRNGAVQALFAATKECRDESEPWGSLTEQIRHARALRAVAVHDQAMGAHGPQIMHEAEEYLKTLEEELDQCINDIARVESKMSRARCQWGKMSEALFDKRKSRVIKSKGRVRVKVGGSQRKFVLAMMYTNDLISAAEYMAMEKLELP